MKKKKSLLVIDDDALFNELLCRQLKTMGYRTESALSWAEAQRRLEQIEPDALILDYKLPDVTASEILGEIRGQYPVIILTGYGSIPNAVRAIREGAADFLTKPVELDALELTVRRVLEHAELQASNRLYRHQLAAHLPGPLVFASSAMAEINRLIDAVAPTDTTVLIMGESGTGKEMVARAIHERSDRRDRELITLDATGLQETLFESELFGHEKGAFTGADRLKKGLIEEAAGSTLFIDEIGDITPAIQAKLLRLLETGTFRRVGGTKTLTADVRFIAATNHDLEARVREGSFRSDLWFRLSRFVIELPPLRERREDIELLARHMLAQLSRHQPMQLTRAALHLLLEHDWPGNVRELRNALERATILARPGDTIRAEHLAFLAQNRPGEVVLRFSHEPTLAEIEQRYFTEIFAKYGGNRQKVAEVLGLSERHVYRLIDRYGLGKRGSELGTQTIPTDS